MKCRILVEDRALAYLFIDVDDAPPGARIIEVVLGKDVTDIMATGDEDKFVWIAESDDYYVVWAQERFKDHWDRGHQVPNPDVLRNVAEYDALYD